MAREAADEAAAARRIVPPGAGGSQRAEPRPPRGVIDPTAVQQCRYRGMQCMGCGGFFRRGEQMRGGGAGFVHTTRACARAAAEAVQREAEQMGAGREAAASSGQTISVTADRARAYSIWARLEREYALGDGRTAEAGGLLLPRHSRECFVRFARWVASDAERARSLSHVRLAVGTFLPQTRLADWSTDDEIANVLGQQDEPAVDGV